MRSTPPANDMRQFRCGTTLSPRVFVSILLLPPPSVPHFFLNLAPRRHLARHPMPPPPSHRKNQPELPYADNSFDFVTIPNTMEFFTDPRLVMREAYRVLKPQGLCLVPFTSQGAYKVNYVRSCGCDACVCTLLAAFVSFRGEGRGGERASAIFAGCYVRRSRQAGVRGGS